MFLPVVEPENLIANFLLCNFCFQLIRHLMHMSLEKTTLLESLCFRSGGVWTLKLKIMLWWFLNLVVDLKLLFQSKISVISCHLIFGLCVLCNICICCIQIFFMGFCLFLPQSVQRKGWSRCCRSPTFVWWSWLARCCKRYQCFQLTGLRQMVQRRFVPDHVLSR